MYYDGLMETKIKEHSPYSIIIQKGREKFIGFLTMSRMKREENAWIVSESSVEAWEIKGIIEHNKRNYLYGPYFDGPFLADIIDTITLDQIRTIVRAYGRIQDFAPFGGLHSYGIMLGKKVHGSS